MISSDKVVLTFFFRDHYNTRVDLENVAKEKKEQNLYDIL